MYKRKKKKNRKVLIASNYYCYEQVYWNYIHGEEHTISNELIKEIYYQLLTVIAILYYYIML